MARKIMVTRTIKMTSALVKILNLDTETVFSETVNIPHTFKNDKEILDKAKEIRESCCISHV